MEQGEERKPADGKGKDSNKSVEAYEPTGIFSIKKSKNPQKYSSAF